MVRPANLTSVVRRLPSRGRLRPQHSCLSLKAERKRNRATIADPPPLGGVSVSLGASTVRPFAEASPDPLREPRKDLESSGTDIGSEAGELPQPPQPTDAAPFAQVTRRKRRTGPSSKPVDEEVLKDETLDSSATAVARVPLPEPLVVTPRRVRQPFDTHRFVSKLSEASVEPDVAKALMESVRGLITQRVDRATASMLSKEELDNEAYLFKAALSKLRTEWNVRNRNAGIEGRNVLSAIRRDLDGVELKMGEDIQTLKHEIELDMGDRKTDTRSDMKQTSITIEEINNRATISIGDLKTEIESAKWEATRRAIAIIVALVVFGVGMSTVTFGADPTKAKPPKPEPIDPAAHPASWSPAPATRDIGIGTDDDFDYEARIDKLLSEVERAERKEPKPRPRSRSKPEPFIERI